MAWDFGINLGIDPSKWFGEDRDDEVRADNVAEQRNFAQNAIRWKTEDAQRAGLHPLFALSGNNATFSPNAVSVGGETSIGISPRGAPSGVRDAAESRQGKNLEMLAEREQQSRHARTMSEIATDTEQQALLRAQTDLVRQQIKDSIDGRAGQVGRINKEREAFSHTPTNPEDAFETKPRPIMQGTASSGGAIGVGPASAGFEPVWIAPGLPALVPAGAAQNLGDMELSGWLVTAAATMLWWGDAASRAVVEQARRAGHYLFTREVADKAAELFRSSGRDTSGGNPQ